MWTLFEYLYRDAGNFKAFGCAALKGRIDPESRGRIQRKLEGGEFFVAEQVGVPPLYELLYQWSNGPTVSDHCWHEFIGFREIKVSPAGCARVGNAADFVKRITSLSGWDLRLSPHFDLAEIR